jgi:hypothetical protein
MERNPLFAFPSTAPDRRRVLRAIARVGAKHADIRPLMDAFKDGLSDAWPYYEHALHVDGAMSSIVGPLARVASALAKHKTGNDYFIELGAVAQTVEWASTLGAHMAPFESADFSAHGHAAFLLALHGGVEDKSSKAIGATAFDVATDLLVIDNDVNVIDFVQAVGSGDLARFRKLVSGLARPGRSQDEVTELVSLWNSQLRAYERRPERFRTMGLSGIALGGLSKVVGAPDLISLSAALLPALITYVNEDVVGEQPSVSVLLDEMNGKLAGVHRDAVLLARMRKLVKGMRS